MPRKPKDENDQLAKAIGMRLQSALDRMGISVTDLHKRTGISRTVLLAYVRGNYAPGARELKLLCEHLEVTPTMILFGSNEVVQAPYRIGDLAISSDGARMIAMLMFLGRLSPPEQTALITLVEGIVLARDPEGHAQLTKSLKFMLGSKEGQQIMDAITQTVETNFEERGAEIEAAAKEAGLG